MVNGKERRGGESVIVRIIIATLVSLGLGYLISTFVQHIDSDEDREI